MKLNFQYLSFVLAFFCVSTVLLQTAEAQVSTAFEATFTGDGVLTDQSVFPPSSTPLGSTTLAFSYNTVDFAFQQTFNLGGGTTGTGWASVAPSPLTIFAGAQSFTADPIIGVTMFDQPTGSDQFNFALGAGGLIQWNDSTSSAFAGPVTTDFSIANSMLIDQVANTASLVLAGGGLTILRINGDPNLTLEINNAFVLFAIPGDACADAIALPSTFADTPYFAAGATTDGVDLFGYCDIGPIGDENVHNDVWFTYVPDVGGCTYISTVGLAGIDTRLAIYNGNNCPNDPSTVLACVDDEVLPLIAPPFEAGMDVTLVAGETYLIRLGTYLPNVANGSGALRIAAGPQAAANQVGETNPGAPGCDTFTSLCNGDQAFAGCAACSCNNPGLAGAIGGCAHSESASNGGFGGRLIATGSASVSLPFGMATTNDLKISAENLPAGVTAVLFSGAGVVPNGNPTAMCFRQGADGGGLKDGLRCAINAGGGLFRHGNRQANAMGNIMDDTGPNRTWGGAAQPHGGLANNPGTNPGFVAGQTRFFDATYRDIAWGTCATGINTTNAVRVTFTP